MGATEEEGLTESDKKDHKPERVLGLFSVIAITYFCVSGGAYGLERMFI